MQGYRVDYRLQMWFGRSAEVPHGIFLSKKVSLVEYEGLCLELEPLPETILQALQFGIEIELLSWEVMKKAVTSEHSV